VTRGRRGAPILFGAAAAAYALDRATKAWAEAALEGGPPIRLLPGVDLRFTTNSGGAFSIGRSAPLVFVGATLLVSGLILVTAFRERGGWTAAALGMVLGGALGNLTDRALRGPGLSGEVVDFIDLHWWPVFNLADAAIVAGAGLLALGSLRRRRPERDDGS
jgi:signal peptidase II